MRLACARLAVAGAVLLGLAGGAGSRECREPDEAALDRHGHYRNHNGAEVHRPAKKCELLACRRSRSQAEARMACFSYIEGFYNPLRRHSALGYRSPVAYERETALEASTTNLLSQVP